MSLLDPAHEVLHPPADLPAAGPERRHPDRPGPTRRTFGALLSVRLAGIWVLLGMVALFGGLRPETFLSQVTLKTTLGDQAITGLLALGILLPMVAGMIDLSIANVAGFAMVLSTWLAANTGLPTPVVLLVTLAASLAFGAVSAFFVTKLRVDSLIVTLGVGTVALGLTQLVAGHNTITVEFGHLYSNLGQSYLGVVPITFLFVFLVAALMYYVLEHMPVGRRLQAVGGNPTAARLAGIRVVRLQVATLLTAAALAGVTGFILAAKVGIATDSTAPGYLLPAAAALFLGSTQFKDRPNVAGTVLAMLILGTGIKGLQLLGASAWVTDFFAGSVLLFSVGISSRGRNRHR